eukprot:Skav233240  [mRNA]  locus=scaffold2786:17343:18913:- [translate_table: standard]
MDHLPSLSATSHVQPPAPQQPCAQAIKINQSLSALGDVIAARVGKPSSWTDAVEVGLSGRRFKDLDAAADQPLRQSRGGSNRPARGGVSFQDTLRYDMQESMCSLTFGARVNAVEMKKS